MPKAIVQHSYTDYVLELEDAIKLVTLLASAEVHRSKYHSKTENQESFTSYHIFPQEGKGVGRTTFTVLSDDEYRKAKLLGKPDE